MNLKFKRFTAAVAALLIGTASVSLPSEEPAITASAAGSYVVENLDRGISAINTGSGMLVNWRFLANDDDNAVFKLYRDNTLIYTSNAGNATCYLDAGGSASSVYKVETYTAAGALKTTDTCKLSSANSYFDVKLDNPGSIYSPNDCSVGDVDGDGQYELFVKWDPNNSQDNSKSGKTDKVYIDCYRLDGTKLWRIDLGYNIRAGAHYTQFLVGDFDLDGKAEMTCKTADGTVDGVGNTIGDGSASYRNSKGYILTGPEYYTLFDGETGAALDTVDYEPARGTVSSWGDSYGNRVDRFLGAVVYLDGVTPCPVTIRGYYTRMTACAYKVENDKLVKQWYFDTGNSSSANGYGDGNHNCMPADVDGDGKQEIFLGAACIDDNGTILWNTNKGHGDAMHLGDLLPDNPGLEAWVCHEVSPYGGTLIDCQNGATIFHVDADSDTGRCGAANIWTGNDGAEFWVNNTVYNGSGTALSCRRPALNFLSYWDGDLEREILDGYTDSPATINDMGADGKLTQILSTDGYYTCNTTKGTPCLSADIFGDWREELIVRAADGKSVRIYATTYDTDYRITTLMHDPQYRNQVAGQNIAYNQPPHPSFYLGSEKELPARPQVTVGDAAVGKTGAVIDTSHKYMIKNVGSGLCLEVAGGTAANGTNVQQGNSEYNVWNLQDAGNGYYYIYSDLGDGATYLLDLDYGKVDNGTNIGIWGNTNSDAQLFKFVSNGDGTYTICTKPTEDNSCIGIESGSTANGANVVQWACDGSDNQKWTLEIKVEPLDGSLIKNLMRNDTERYQFWSIVPSLKSGEMLYGDREFTYVELPAEINGAEAIRTSCDSKYYASDLASFTSGADMSVYVAMDSRVTTLPTWLGDWENTGLTVMSSNDVTFNFYKKNFKSGDTVILGTNGQSAGCVSYTVFAKALPVSGTLILDLNVLDNENADAWSLIPSVNSGDTLYGDRDVTYVNLPSELIGAETIRTACDSKNSTSDLAKFIAGDDITVYAAFDTRVTALPEWVSGWTDTGLTFTHSNGTEFAVYSMDYAAGDTVILGTNGQSTSCVNYTVFAKKQAEQQVTTTTTVTAPVATTTTTVTTVPVENIVYGDADLSGGVEIADAVKIMCYIADGANNPMTAEELDNADVYQRGDGISNMDALAVQKYLAQLIPELPESIL